MDKFANKGNSSNKCLWVILLYLEIRKEIFILKQYQQKFKSLICSASFEFIPQKEYVKK